MTNRNGIPVLSNRRVGQKPGPATQPKKIRPQTATTMPRRSVLWDKFKGRCHYCNAPLVSWRAGNRPGVLPHQKPTIDHKIPKALGGTSEIDNLVLSCATCNGRKGAMAYEVFVSETGSRSGL